MRRLLLLSALLAGSMRAEGVWFEENQGQVTGAVRFVARGPGYHLYLNPTSATAALFGKADEPLRVVTMELVGARRDAGMEGEEETGDRSSYFVGNNLARWLKGLAHYRSVRTQGVWPGVDVRYYQNGRRAMEHDFVVAPGADASAIRFRFDGAKPELLADGALRIGEMRWERPVAYQLAGGDKREVPSRYVVDADGVVGFSLGEWDRKLELVIDPEMLYARFVGGSASDQVSDIAYRPGTDEVVVVGSASSVDLPVLNAYQGVLRGTRDVFVLRTTQTGPRHFTYFGGSGEDFGSAVALDGAGNAYVTGSTFSVDFPVTGLSNTLGGFVFKLTPDGALAYSARIAGTEVSAIAVDAAGAAYVAGRARDAGGASDAAVAKLNPAGTALVYATYLGGAGRDGANGIAVNAAGEAFVAGFTESPGLATAGALRQSPAGIDGFVARLNAAGSAAYFTYYGGSGDDSINAVALDGDQAIIGGGTLSANLPVVNAVQAALGGGQDGFIAVVNGTGSALTMSTYLGGTGFDLVRDLAAANAQSIVVVGSRLLGTFPLVNPLYSFDGSGSFLTSIRANPNYAIGFSTFLPVGATFVGEEVTTVAIDPADLANRIYIGGTLSGTRFPADRRGAREAVGETTPELFNEGFFARFTTSTGPCVPEFWADPSVDGRSLVLQAGVQAYGTLKVRSPHNCNWTIGVPAAASWLSLGNPSGFGIDSIQAVAPVNTGPTRSAALTISPGGSSVVVTQAGVECEYSFNPIRLVLGQSGNTETLTLTTSAGCPWRYPPNPTPPWLTMRQISGSEEQGPAIFSVTSVGTSASPEEFNLSFGVSGVRVFRGACGIRFPLGADLLQAPAAGATFTVQVDAAAGCAWRSSSWPDWALPVPAEGVGPTAVQVIVARNPEGERAGDVQFGGAPVRIRQEGFPVPANCTYRVAPGVRSYDYFGGTGRFEVITQPGCGWRVDSAEVQVTGGPFPMLASGEVNFRVPFNGTGSGRGLQILVRNSRGEIVLTFTILQGGVHPRLPQMLPMTVGSPGFSGFGFGQRPTPWIFRFADGEGGADIEEMRMRLGSQRDDPDGCEIVYRRSTNLLTAGGQSVAPGASATLVTGICRIDVSLSSVVTDGDLVEVRLTVLLPTDKRLVGYGFAIDRKGNSWPWTAVGVTGTQPREPGKPWVQGMTPDSAGFDRETFEFVAGHGAGYTNLESISVLVNDALDPQRACYFGYHRATNTVLLLNDDATAYVNSLTPGNGGLIQNNQCGIEDAGSAAGSGDTLALRLKIQFRRGFSGSRVFHVAAQDATSTSGWIPAGFYRVQPQ